MRDPAEAAHSGPLTHEVIARVALSTSALRLHRQGVRSSVLRLARSRAACVGGEAPALRGTRRLGSAVAEEGRRVQVCSALPFARRRERNEHRLTIAAYGPE
jgi:hypothetical protein